MKICYNTCCEGRLENMEALKEQYAKIVSERKGLIEQINILAEDETVKNYLELHSQNDKLANQQKDLYKQIKVEEYSSCNHIWVNTLHDYDSWEGRSYNYCGCIKCGLDKRVFHLVESYHSPDWLTFDQRIMYDLLRKHSYRAGIDTNLLCDLDLAKAIYSKIKEVYPDIDDETAIKYFKVALHNIRDTKVSEERKSSRAKRLSLKPDFNKWTGWDVSRH